MTMKYHITPHIAPTSAKVGQHFRTKHGPCTMFITGRSPTTTTFRPVRNPSCQITVKHKRLPPSNP